MQHDPSGTTNGSTLNSVTTPPSHFSDGNLQSGGLQEHLEHLSKTATVNPIVALPTYITEPGLGVLQSWELQTKLTQLVQPSNREPSLLPKEIQDAEIKIPKIIVNQILKNDKWGIEKNIEEFLKHEGININPVFLLEEVLSLSPTIYGGLCFRFNYTNLIDPQDVEKLKQYTKSVDHRPTKRKYISYALPGIDWQRYLTDVMEDHGKIYSSVTIATALSNLNLILSVSNLTPLFEMIIDAVRTAINHLDCNGWRPEPVDGDPYKPFVYLINQYTKTTQSKIKRVCDAESVTSVDVKGSMKIPKKIIESMLNYAYIGDIKDKLGTYLKQVKINIDPVTFLEEMLSLEPLISGGVCFSFNYDWLLNIGCKEIVDKNTRGVIYKATKNSLIDYKLPKVNWLNCTKATRGITEGFRLFPNLTMVEEVHLALDNTNLTPLFEYVLDIVKLEIHRLKAFKIEPTEDYYYKTFVEHFETHSPNMKPNTENEVEPVATQTEPPTTTDTDSNEKDNTVSEPMTQPSNAVVPPTLFIKSYLDMLAKLPTVVFIEGSTNCIDLDKTFVDDEAATNAIKPMKETFKLSIEERNYAYIKISYPTFSGSYSSIIPLIHGRLFGDRLTFVPGYEFPDGKFYEYRFSNQVTCKRDGGLTDDVETKILRKQLAMTLMIETSRVVGKLNFEHMWGLKAN